MMMMRIATQQERYTPLASSPGTTCTSRTSHSGARLPEHLNDDGDGCCNYDHHNDNGIITIKWNYYKLILREWRRGKGVPQPMRKSTVPVVLNCFLISILSFTNGNDKPFIKRISFFLTLEEY